MDFSIGLIDRLFGERMTLEVPSADGKIVKREVTRKWFDNMVAEKKIVRQDTAANEQEAISRIEGGVITEKEAAAFFSQIYKDRVHSEWPGLARQINSTLKSDLPDDLESVVEVLSAVISFQLGCLPNLFPQQQANRLRGAVLAMLKGDIVERMASYDRVWKKAIEENLYPQEAIATTLVYDRFGSKKRVQIGQRSVASPLLVSLVGAALLELSSAWWKELSSKYRIVP